MRNVDTEGVDLTSCHTRIRLPDLTLLSQSSRERDAEAPPDDHCASHLSTQTVQDGLGLAYGHSGRLPGGMGSPSGRMWNRLRSSCNRSSRSRGDLSPQVTTNLRNGVSSVHMPVGQHPDGIWTETDCSTSRTAPQMGQAGAAEEEGGTHCHNVS